MSDDRAWVVLRDGQGLLHIDASGVPVCGYGGEVVSMIHPADRAGMWCSACLGKVVNDVANDDDDRPRVPVYAGDTAEVIAYIPVDPAFAAELARDGNRTCLRL